MAGKKLVALTNIKHDGNEINAGDEVDAGMFSKEQLQDLVDNGAVEVSGSDNKSDDKPAEAPKAEEKPSTPSTPTKSTPASK